MAYTYDAVDPRKKPPEKEPAQQSAVAQPAGIAPAGSFSATSVNEDVAKAIADGTMDTAGAQSQYGVMAAQAMDRAQSMGPFNYDFNNDAVFKSLQNSYMKQARRAAADASAMAAARTGGYGNSYGAVAASQQYNNALQDLYDQIPELQSAAYNRYLNDKQDLYSQRDYYQQLEDELYGRNYTEGRDKIGDEQWQQQFDYGKERDAVGDEQWRQQFEYGKERDTVGDEQWKQQFDADREDVGWEHGMAEKQYANEVDRQKRQDAVDNWVRDFETAQYAASLGNYGPLEELLGVDFSGTRNDDALNRALTIISAGGLTGEEALAFLHDYLGLDFSDLLGGYDESGGSGGSGGSKGSSGGGYSGYTGNQGTQQTVPQATQQANGTKPVTKVTDITEEELMDWILGK